MTKTNKLQKNYTASTAYYQTKFPFDLDIIIPSDDSVRLLSQYIERIDLTKLYSTYKRINKKKPTPTQMLKILIYAYMNKTYSSRDIEKSCNRDINFKFLLEDKDAPDHSSIARFRTFHFAECSKSIMSSSVSELVNLNEISTQQLFLDGTKIEANANKYTFVWKKAVNKHLKKLFDKISNLFMECEYNYGFKMIYGDSIQLKHLKKLRKKLYKIKQEEQITFVNGKGKRKNILQIHIESLESYISKLKEYINKLHIVGKRNSYSKTDRDATFMRMKEDHMKNGQLKPAYNLQLGVDSEYIVWLTINSNPSDTNTLIPFLEDFNSNSKFKYKKIVADAGYESEENYVYLNKNNQDAFIKPINHEIQKKRKFKKDISKVENMTYIEKDDTYICAANKKILPVETINKTSRSGYSSIKTIYSCNDCKNCELKSQCIPGKNWKKPIHERYKKLEISKIFKENRKLSNSRINSNEGMNLRMNRSIQVEGAFGVIKEDMSFRKYLTRGNNNVLAENMVLAIAFNINKLHRKIQSDRTGTYLFNKINSE